MRTAWNWLVHAFAAALVVQFFLAGYGVFAAWPHGDPEAHFDAHASLGTLLTVVSLILLLLAALGRFDRRLTGLSGLLFILMLVQNVLAEIGKDHAWVGALHAVTAMVIVALLVVMVRDSRRIPARVTVP